MPKSKRAKVVPLTQTKKKTRDNKEKLVGLVRDCVDEFSCAYVFRYENMRNATLKELRDKLHGSARFFLGSNKVLQVALGRGEGEEHRPGLAALAQRLRGGAGLVFTNLTREELETRLAECAVAHYARAGAVAEETVELEAGALLFRGALPFPHTGEPALRAAGVPCRLRAGVVELIAPHTVCVEGSLLTAPQASVLKALDLKLATFTMELDSVWDSSGAFEVLSEPPEEAARAAAEMMGDDGGDFSFQEVEVADDDPRALRARRGGGKGKARATRAGKAGDAAEDEEDAEW